MDIVQWTTKIMKWKPSPGHCQWPIGGQDHSAAAAQAALSSRIKRVRGRQISLMCLFSGGFLWWMLLLFSGLADVQVYGWVLVVCGVFAVGHLLHVEAWLKQS